MFLFLFIFWIVGVRGEIGQEVNDIEPKLPEFIKICHRSDPNLNDCIKNAVEVIRPYLKKGIPELSIPACEPLIIPEIVMNQGRGSVAIQSKYTDVQVYGPSNFDLLQVKVDLEKYKVKIKLRLPRLDVIGNYTISGKILMMPIAGSGACKGNYSDIDATAIMTGEKFEKDGKTYVNVKEFLIDFNIGHASIHFTNLFNGDKQLGDTMNDFINDNWKNVAQEIKPVLENVIANLFKEYANKIYRNYPLELLLPP